MDPIISPASSLMHNGVAVFQDLSQLDGFKTPYTINMNLMVVCTRGAISATVDLDMMKMTRSQMMFLRPGHVINDITRSEDFTGFFILIDESKFSTTIPLSGAYMASCLVYFKGNSVVSIDETELENLQMIYSMLRRKMYRLTQPYNQLTFNTLCELLFLETMSIYTSVMDRRTAKPTRREELLSRFIRLVEEHFREERSVAYYARKLCLSPKHLSAVVKNASGMTAGEWIDGKVIREAKLMLRNSPRTIQQISTDLHFANQSFFGKYFKNLTGMTPRQYRTNPDLMPKEVE